MELGLGLSHLADAALRDLACALPAELEVARSSSTVAGFMLCVESPE